MNNSNETIENLVIIGGGPTGYTAGIYASRAALNPTIFAGYQAGGQLMLTTDVENFPGFPEGILGPKLMDEFRLQAEKFGSKIFNEDVIGLDLTQHPYVVKTYDKEIKTHSIIIATGASAKWLDLENEKELIGSGLSSCATCDGAFFKDANIAVVGGGDSAMEEALFLTKYARKVTLIHRRSEFRASKIMATRVMKHPKIEIIWDTIVTKYLYEKDGFISKLTGINLKNVNTNEVTEMNLDGLFMAIGHIPNTDFLPDVISKTSEGYLETNIHTMTNIDGVFAAGDVVDTRYRQAITAAADGCKSAIDAEKWLSENEIID